MIPFQQHNQNPKPTLILIGGGGHCLSCIDVVELTKDWDIAGILDKPEKVGQNIHQYPIVGTDDDIERLANEGHHFLITVGQIKSSSVRRLIYNRIVNAGGILPIIVSPLAYVSSKASLSEGTIVMHHALVNSDAKIGKCAIVNTKALIEHEVSIGDFCHISTNAVINGQVAVGNDVFIGSNATIANNINIASGAVIAAGGKVYKPIETPGVHLGTKTER